MSKRDWKLYCEDILESIELIEQYVEGMTFDNFTKDRKTIDAVARNFEIIGEASKYIPDQIKQKYPELVLSLDIIWYITKKELPLLKNQIKQSN